MRVRLQHRGRLRVTESPLHRHDVAPGRDKSGGVEVRDAKDRLAAQHDCEYAAEDRESAAADRNDPNESADER